jgi:formiminotetrahydrofolate cyclodeaminase
VEGALLNVRINAAELRDHPEVKQILEKAASLQAEALDWKDKILGLVNSSIGE